MRDRSMVIWELGIGMWYSEEKMKKTNSNREIEVKEEKTEQAAL